MRVLMASFGMRLNSVGARETEIMLNLKERGDEIYFLECIGLSKAGCGLTFDKKSSFCKECIYKRKKNLRITGLDHYIKEFINIDHIFSNGKNYFPYHEYRSLEELMALEYKGIDIGRGIAAVMIDFTRDSEPEITDEYQKMIHTYVNELAGYIDYLEKVVKEYQIEAAYVFNGRKPYYRATLRVMQMNHIDVFVHEVSAVPGKYRLDHNTYAHSVILSDRETTELWNAAPDFQEREQRAQAYYRNRESGTDELMKRFVEHQRVGELQCIKPGCINVAIFISSEDEFVTIKEHDIFYKNQNDALMQISKSEWDKNINFIIRVHPNLKGLDNAQTKGLKDICGDNITIIPSESEVSTYQLVRECDLAIVFHSTVGIEACFRKKPVIIIGYPIYYDLVNTVKPKDHKSLCAAINNFAAIDFHIEENYIAALKYAWYMINYGVEFRHFLMKDLFHYEYTGERNKWFCYYKVREFIRIRVNELRKWKEGEKKRT